MNQTAFSFDAILEATPARTSSISRPSAPRILSEQHDMSRINFVAGMTDPGEMIRCGYRPELRRIAGETDAVYAERIRPLVMALPQHERDVIMNAAINRAKLGTTRGKINLFTAFTPPWMELGVTVDRCLNSAEALHTASLDNWNLTKQEQWIDWEGVKKLTGAYAIVRGDNGAILTYGSSVGGGYEIFSNEQCFDFTDQIIGAGAKFHTAGALGNGETVWMLAEMPEVIEHAPGDVSHTYLFVGANHDGKGAIWTFPTSTRVVCANSRRIAMNGKRLGCSFRHTKNVHQKAVQAQQALGLARKSAEEDKKLSDRLVSTPLPQPREYFEACLDSIVDVTVAGMPLTRKNLDGAELLSAMFKLDSAERKAAERTVEKTREKRSALLGEILDRYHSDRNNGMPAIAGTAWSAYNAVTETADHSAKLNKFRGSDRDRQESRFNSVLEGKAADVKDMALETVLAIAK